MTTNTLSKFGVPIDSSGDRIGILQPKTKWKFSVVFTNFGPIAGSIAMTQQIATCGRPSIQHDAVSVASYNSTAYYAGKGIWQPLEITVRDDVTNSVNQLVSHQLQKQMNHFEQTTFTAGQNYKFSMLINTLDGGNDAPLEQFFLEGCFLESANYDSFDYSSNDPVMITMSVRYDNATQTGGLMTDNPDFIPGFSIG